MQAQRYMLACLRALSYSVLALQQQQPSCVLSSKPEYATLFLWEVSPPALHWGTLEKQLSHVLRFWGCAKGAEEASCREKRSSKKVFLESPFRLCPLKVFRCFKGKPWGVG